MQKAGFLMAQLIYQQILLFTENGYLLQLQSLEESLRVTEEQLHQERADRANNLSTAEEKLLSENATGSRQVSGKIES